jgi:hypothetical protein
MSTERIETDRNSGRAKTSAIQEVLLRIHGEYREMPGLSLTTSQAERLWGLDSSTCVVVLTMLTERGVLRQTSTGRYLRGPLG